MPLKACRECGQEVSTAADACPHCGVKNPAKAWYNQSIGCGGCLGVLLLAGVGFVFLVMTAAPPATYQPDVSGFGGSAPTQVAEVADWRWEKDADFGTTGAVIWEGTVRNLTNEYVDLVRVEFTSSDAGGRVVTTDFTYARGLQPNGTATFKGYATYYGSEETASVRIVR